MVWSESLGLVAEMKARFGTGKVVREKPSWLMLKYGLTDLRNLVIAHAVHTQSW